MSSLILYGQTYHLQWYAAGKKQSKSLRTSDHAEAKRQQQIFDGQLAAGDDMRKLPRLVIAEEIEAFLTYKKPCICYNSLRLYRYALSGMLRALAPQGIAYADQLIPDVISRAIAHFTGPLGCKLFQPQYAVWKAWCYWLQDQGKTKALICQRWPKVRTPSCNPARNQAYTGDEIRRLLEAVGNHPFRTYILFGLYTGARVGEMYLLLVRDVDLTARIVNLRNEKTDRYSPPYRPIPIHDALFPALKEKIEALPWRSAVFSDYCPNYFSKFMKKFCGIAGITHRRFHGLRHTFVSHLLASGVDIRSVMALAGHRRLETTQRYASLVAGLPDINRLKF
jgi:site-specific recombinase XerD